MESNPLTNTPPPQSERSSAVSSVFTLLSSAVGAGILSLPYAFRSAGWAGGLFVIILIATIESFTLYVLSRYAETSGSKTYTQLCTKYLGKGAGAFMSLLLFAYLFGSSIAYLIILGDSFHPILQWLAGQDSTAWWMSRQFVIGIISSSVSLPLCFPTSLHAISRFTALTSAGLIAIVSIVLVKSIQVIHQSQEHDGGGEDRGHMVPSTFPSLQFFNAIPIMIFGFQCHCQVITVFQELHPDSDPLIYYPPSPETGETGWSLQPWLMLLGRRLRIPRTKKLTVMTEIIISAITMTCLGYVTVGLSGYAAFPNSVSSNVLNSFPSDDGAMQLARAAVGCIQLISFPVNHFPARAALQDLVAHVWFGDSEQHSSFIQEEQHMASFHNPWSLFNIVEVLLFFGSSLTLAMFITDLGLVFKLIGGTGGGILILGIPGALLIQYAVAKHNNSSGSGNMNRGEGEDQEEPLLDSNNGGGGGGGEPYSLWFSKLFWAGITLIILNAGLFFLTIYMVVLES
jgi:sodium-coupled neutral amino acid transporter 7/8